MLDDEELRRSDIFIAWGVSPRFRHGPIEFRSPRRVATESCFNVSLSD